MTARRSYANYVFIPFKRTLQKFVDIFLSVYIGLGACVAWSHQLGIL